MTKVMFTKFFGLAHGLLFYFVLILGAPVLAAPSDPLPDLVEKILPGVVNVSVSSTLSNNAVGMSEFLQFWGIPQERKQSTLGSGFLIDSSGYLITNSHVVEEAQEVVAVLWDKRQFNARVVGRDSKLDIALLQIRDSSRKPPTGLVPCTLGDSDPVRIAQSVLAIGNPFGLQHTVTRGIISAKNRTIGIGPLDNFLQTDASINPGNSGGPLFDLNGTVIGVNTVIYSRTGQSGGLGFAIPINEVKKILGDLKQYGRVPRPWLGVLGERVTPQMANYYGLATTSGILIYNLVQGGPAQAAGIKQGDVVTSFAGEPLVEPYDLERLLARHKPNEQIEIMFKRGKKERKLSLKLQELPPRIEKLPAGII